MYDDQKPTTYEATYAEHRKARGAQRGNQNARRFDPETSVARLIENRRRNSAATHRALKVLADQHREEFQAYLNIARAEITQERGPLPGD